MARGVEQSEAVHYNNSSSNMPMGFSDSWESCEQILQETLDHDVTPLIKTEFDHYELPPFLGSVAVDPSSFSPSSSLSSSLGAEEQLLPDLSEKEEDAQSQTSTMEIDHEEADHNFGGSFYDLSDDQIANMNFKELSRLMRDASLTDDAINEVKALRRRLKNRHSARICSNKKRERCVELGETNRQLYSDLAGLKDRNQQLEVELNRANKTADLLRQFIFKSGLVQSLDAATRSSLGF